MANIYENNRHRYRSHQQRPLERIQGRNKLDGYLRRSKKSFTPTECDDFTDQKENRLDRKAPKRMRARDKCQADGVLENENN